MDALIEFGFLVTARPDAAASTSAPCRIHGCRGPMKSSCNSGISAPAAASRIRWQRLPPSQQVALKGQAGALQVCLRVANWCSARICDPIDSNARQSRTFDLWLCVPGRRRRQREVRRDLPPDAGSEPAEVSVPAVINEGIVHRQWAYMATSSETGLSSAPSLCYWASCR